MQLVHKRRSLLISAAILAAGLGAGCGADAGVKPPQDSSEYVAERPSAQGGFRVSYRTDGPVPVGRLHAWTLHVARPDGTPVTDAVVAVDGDMPEHRHGLPTRPRVTRHLGNGDYLVEGVKFQMGGWWVMEVTVDAGGRHDVAKFNLRLDS